MNWKNIFKLQTWQDVATELFWRATANTKSDTAPSWPLDEEKLTKTVIEWPAAYLRHKWLIHIQTGLAHHVHLEIKEIPQPDGAVALINLIKNGSRYLVAIDFSDYVTIDHKIVKAAPIYFKMQFHRNGYPFENVIPGGYIPNNVNLYTYLPHVRAIQANKRPYFDVTGRFSLEFAKGIRQKALKILSEQKAFNFQGSAKAVRYSRFLRELVRSRICVDLPGNGDFCFRLIDYLAVGSCIIGPKHGNKLHVTLEDRKHIVYTKADLSDLVALCKYYLDHEEERKALCRNSREFFDRYLHHDQIAAYYLTCCFEAIKSLV